MPSEPLSLAAVYQGWGDTQTSLVHSLAPLTAAQLALYPRANLRSAGEIAYHIAEGRLTWFARMGAPGSAELAARAAITDPAIVKRDAAKLVQWLEDTWDMVAGTLEAWTTADLAETYRHEYQGQVYAVSRQWTIWRILAHDLHHAGELSVMLGLQGIAVPELGDMGGHLTYPPLAGDQPSAA